MSECMATSSPGTSSRRFTCSLRTSATCTLPLRRVCEATPTTSSSVIRYTQQHTHHLLCVCCCCLCARLIAFAQYCVPPQISVCHFVLRVLRPSAKILFYCHYPDQLLSARASVFKTLYRLPFDVVEEITTGMADAIVCNSNFTRQVFHKTFRLLQSVSPGVLHPCVDLGTIDRCVCHTCAHLRQPFGEC